MIYTTNLAKLISAFYNNRPVGLASNRKKPDVIDVRTKTGAYLTSAYPERVLPVAQRVTISKLYQRNPIILRPSLLEGYPWSNSAFDPNTILSRTTNIYIIYTLRFGLERYSLRLKLVIYALRYILRLKLVIYVLRFFLPVWLAV